MSNHEIASSPKFTGEVEQSILDSQLSNAAYAGLADAVLTTYSPYTADPYDGIFYSIRIPDQHLNPAHFLQHIFAHTHRSLRLEKTSSVTKSETVLVDGAEVKYVLIKAHHAFFVENNSEELAIEIIDWMYDQLHVALSQFIPKPLDQAQLSFESEMTYSLIKNNREISSENIILMNRALKRIPSPLLLDSEGKEYRIVTKFTITYKQPANLFTVGRTCWIEYEKPELNVQQIAELKNNWYFNRSQTICTKKNVFGSRTAKNAHGAVAT